MRRIYPPSFKFFYCPGYRALVEVIVPDKGFLHDVLLPVQQHQDRELARGEAQRPEPVVEKDEPAAAGEGDNRPEGDIRPVCGDFMCTSKGGGAGR